MRGDPSALGSNEPDRGECRLDGVKYLFVTAIEGCVDVAQHIASAERLGAPTTTRARSARSLRTRAVGAWVLDQ